MGVTPHQQLRVYRDSPAIIGGVRQRKTFQPVVQARTDIRVEPPTFRKPFDTPSGIRTNSNTPHVNPSMYRLQRMQVYENGYQ